MHKGIAPASRRYTVIVPARNEESTIDALLDTLAVQTVPPDEVIVVDTGSKDGTKKRALLQQGRFADLLVVEDEGAFPGKARNIGAFSARHEWLVFVDCGLRIESNCIEKLFQVALEKAGAAAYGHVVPEMPTLFTESAAIAYLPPVIQGGCFKSRRTVQILLMRKSLFESSGGFPEELRSAEDLVFLRRLDRLGWNVEFAEQAVGYWQLAPDFSSTFCRFRTYSRSNLRAGLGRDWQLRIGIYYSLVLLMSLVVWGTTGHLPLALIPPAFFIGLRTVKSQWRHRKDLPAGMFRHLWRFFFVYAILVTLDVATLFGSWDFMRTRDRTGNAVDRTPNEA